MYRPAFFVFFGIFIVFGNVYVYAISHDETSREKCDWHCTSKECLSHINMLMNSIQPNVDPCQDFYSFACSGYVQRYGKDDTKTVYDDTWHSLQVQIKDMLDHLKPEVGSVSEKMKRVYDTCMNDGLSELRSVSEALNFLNSIGIRNWPHLDLNVEFEDSDLAEILGKLAIYGEFSFVTFKPSPYGKEERVNSSRLPPVLILPDNFLLNSKLKPKDVEQTVLKVLAFFNINEDASNILWKEFSDIENLGIRLQNHEAGNSHQCMDGSSGAFINVNCSEEVQDNLIFLCNLWKESVKSGNLGKYFSSDFIHLSCRSNHFHYVENIFSNLTRLTNRSVNNYLAIRFFIAHLDDLNLYFQRIRMSHSSIKGSKQRATNYLSRWEYCTAWLIKSMNLALGYEYTRKHFKKSYQIDVSSIIRHYVKELKIQVMKQDWIKDRVKTYLKNQIDMVNIGFRNTMQNYRNKTLVASCYNEFQPVRGSFLNSMLELQKLSLTLNEKDKMHFKGFYSSSDPYTMDFGFALFLPPTYSYGLSKLWNYATLGWVIGHELSHNLKLLFDLVYLDEQTERNLTEKTNCYMQQYSEFLIEKIGKVIQSKEAEEEIFSDNVGWSLTEKILEKYLAVTNDSLSLPGYEYTPRQLMFIKFAQACCEVLSRDVEYELYSTNPQSVEKLRVLGILQNSKIFSETFNCSSDAVMNPVHKCIFFK